MVCSFFTIRKECNLNSSICDIQLWNTSHYFRFSLAKKSCGGRYEGGQGVQTAFANNPAGLQSRLSKAVELPERTGQSTAWAKHQRWSIQQHQQTNAPEVSCATEHSLLTVVQSVLIYRDVKASRTFIHNSRLFSSIEPHIRLHWRKSLWLQLLSILSMSIC